MSAPAPVLNLLQEQANEIASMACKNLIARHPEIRTRLGAHAADMWRSNLHQRALELSAAIAANDPQVFISRINWSRTAMNARDYTVDDMLFGLDALDAAIKVSVSDTDYTLAHGYIEQAREAINLPLNAEAANQLDAGIDHDALALQYLQTIIAGNTTTAIEIVMDAAANGMTVQDAFLRVLLPAQQEVGRLWHLNEVSVCEEHLVSYTTQRVMANLARQSLRKANNGYTVICGAVAGNVHDIGIRAIAYLLEQEGWRTLYLGSDIPRLELPGVIKSYDADLLMLSVALTSQLASTRKAIAEVRDSDTPVKILIGGNGLNDQPDTWQEIGADGYAADAFGALDTARALVTS